MCMLTAVFPEGNLTVKATNATRVFVTQALLCNSVSNKDGTGLAHIGGDVAKWDERAGIVVCTNEYSLALNKFQSPPGVPMIAHVRTASAGLNAVEGAHPFVHNNIILAHNGTFTNYKALVKSTQITDPDPVDSHVVTHILGDIVGPDNSMTQGHIITALGKTTGSYALLIIDTLANAMWVVRGAAQLYYKKFGPLHILNTSKQNLVTAVLNTRVTASIGGKGLAKWPIGKDPTLVSDYTINRLTAKGLEHIADISRPATTVTYYHGARGARSYQSTYWNASKDSLSEALVKANVVKNILEIPGATESALEFACDRLFNCHWCTLPTMILAQLHRTWFRCAELPTPEKDIVWQSIQLACNYQAYQYLDGLTDIEFPYQVNTLARLAEVQAEIESLAEEGAYLKKEPQSNALVTIP